MQERVAIFSTSTHLEHCHFSCKQVSERRERWREGGEGEGDLGRGDMEGVYFPLQNGTS